MKSKKLFTFLAIFITAVVMAQPPAGKATPGTIYGAKTTAANAVEAAKVPDLLSKKDTISVKVQAVVLDACASKGCWMTLKINDSTKAMVKMKDYAFFVPQDIIGKTVVLEGISFIKTIPISELVHYAEDANKSKQEIEAITKPEKQIRFLANGIVVIK